MLGTIYQTNYAENAKLGSMSEPYEKPQLYYHLNFQDSSILESHPDKFQSVVVNANIVSHASFGVKKFLHDLQKPFIIDPITYAYAMPLKGIIVKDKKTKTEDLKLSYRNLATRYSGPFLKCLELTKLEPSDFSEVQISTQVAENVIAFQRDLPGNVASVVRYRRLRKRKEIAEELRPNFLLTPYFHFETVNDQWYEISLQLCQNAKGFRGDLDLYAVLCLSRDCIQSVEARKEIVKDYAGFDGIVIWVPGMRHETSPASSLVSLKDLISMFVAFKKPVILMHAGYFGALLSKVGLTGFSCGLCYGETKRLVPAAGRLPAPIKYYLPKVHLLRPRDIAALFYSEQNATLLCRCPVCLSIRERIGHASQRDTPKLIGEFFSKILLEEAQEHFLTCRAEEAKMLRNETKATTLKRLESERNFVQNEMSPPPVTTMTNHLQRWIYALT